MIGQALADDITKHADESGEVGAFAGVEAIRLLVQVAEEVGRIDGHVGASDGPLQQRPEVFESVGVDLTVHVGDGVVNRRVLVIVAPSDFRKALVRRMRVGEDVGALFNGGVDLRAKLGLLGGS